MKLKEYRKIVNNMVENQKYLYCMDNDIDFTEFKKAEEKNKKIALGVVCGLCAAVVVLSFVANVTKPKNESKNIQPTNVVRILKERENAPLLAFNPNKKIEFYNYANTEMQYVNVNGTAQPNYIEEFEDSFRLIPYNSAGNASMYFYNIPADDTFFLSDDSNLNAYGEYVVTNEESFNGTFIANYKALSTDMYINLHTPNVSDIYTRWLMNEYLSTGVNRTITRTINYGSFNLDFYDEYVNAYNSFNAIKIEARVKTIDYGYRFAVTLSAVNTSNNYTTTLATTYYSSKASNNTVVKSSNGTFQLSLKNASDLDYRNDFVVMPYLKTLRLHSSSNHPFQNNTTQLGFRAWLDENVTNTPRLPVSSGLNDGDDQRYAEDLWNNFGDLIKVTFTSLMPLASIVILPGITLGAIVIAPFVIGLVILMLRLVKKD